MRLILLLVLVQGCATTDVGGIVEMGVVMAHVNDTEEEYLALMDGQIARLEKWCRRDGWVNGSRYCLRADTIKAEKANYLRTGIRGTGFGSGVGY